MTLLQRILQRVSQQVSHRVSRSASPGLPPERSQPDVAGRCRHGPRSARERQRPRLTRCVPPSLAAGLLLAGALAGGLAGGARAATPYSGVAAFGGTISVIVDAPAAGKLTLRFDESPYGLAGNAISTYKLAGGLYTARQFESDPLHPVPESMKRRLARLQLTFRTAGDTLTGDIARLQNPGTRTPAQLAGPIHASSRRTLPPLSALAGTYSFLRHGGTYTSYTGRLRNGTQVAQAGQMLLDAAGNLRACPGQTYRDGCAGMIGARLRPADQTRWPGAFDVLPVAGDAADADAQQLEQTLGKLFVAARADGGWTLFRGDSIPNVSSVRVDTWIMRPSQELAGAAINGPWRCRHASVPPTEAGVGRLWNGRLSSDVITVVDGRIKSRASGYETSLIRNHAGDPFIGGARPVAAGQAPDRDPDGRVGGPVDGIAWAQWKILFVPRGWPATRDHAILPMDDHSLAYLLQPDEVSPFIAFGMCQRHEPARKKARRGRMQAQ